MTWQGLRWKAITEHGLKLSFPNINHPIYWTKPPQRKCDLHILPSCQKKKLEELGQLKFRFLPLVLHLLLLLVLGQLAENSAAGTLCAGCCPHPAARLLLLLLLGNKSFLKLLSFVVNCP